MLASLRDFRGQSSRGLLRYLSPGNRRFAAGSWGVLELKKLQGKVEDAEYLHKRNIAGDDVESLEKLLEEIETQI